MSERQRNLSVIIRNIAITFAVLIASIVYGVRTMQEYSYYKRLDNARMQCGKENQNAADWLYVSCMRWWGFGNDPVSEFYTR